MFLLLFTSIVLFQTNSHLLTGSFPNKVPCPHLPAAGATLSARFVPSFECPSNNVDFIAVFGEFCYLSELQNEEAGGGSIVRAEWRDRLSVVVAHIRIVTALSI